MEKGPLFVIIAGRGNFLAKKFGGREGKLRWGLTVAAALMFTVIFRV